jgi:hypothetical protein
MSKLKILKKINNESWVDILVSDINELKHLGFIVKRGTRHYKLFHKDLLKSEGRFKSGSVTLNTHKADKERLDFNGAQDLKHVLKFLKVI